MPLIQRASAPQHQQDVDEVMAAAGLGAHLRQHIRQFYTERWQPERGALLVYAVGACCLRLPGWCEGSRNVARLPLGMPSHSSLASRRVPLLHTVCASLRLLQPVACSF